MISFRYYGDAVGKARPRYSQRNGYVQTYTPKKTQDFEEAIQQSFRLAHYPKEIPVYTREVPIKITVDIAVAVPKSWSKKKTEQALDWFIFPTKKPDLDNVLKSIFDALNGYAYEDDAQIVVIESERFYASEPYIQVVVEKYEL